MGFNDYLTVDTEEDEALTRIVADLQQQQSPMTDHNMEATKPNPTDFSVGEYVGMTPGFAMLELVDVIGSSVGVTEKDEIADAVSGELPERMQAFRDENTAAIEVTAGIGGVILASTVGGRLIQGAGFLNKTLRAVPMMRTLAANERRYKAALKNVKLRQIELAKQGVRDVQGLKDPILMARSNAARRIAMQNSVKLGATTEILITATMNQSEFIFPEEASVATLGLFAAAGIAIPPGFSNIATSYAIRKSANANAHWAHAFYDRAGLGVDSARKTMLDEVARGKVGKLADGNIPDFRATEHAITAAALKASRVEGEGVEQLTALAAENANRAQLSNFNSYQSIVKQSLWGRGYAGLVSNATEMPPSMQQHVRVIGEDNPTLFLGTLGMQHAPRNAEDFAEIIAKKDDFIRQKVFDTENLEKSIEAGYRAEAMGLPQATVKVDKVSLTLKQAEMELTIRRQELDDLNNLTAFFVRDAEAVPMEEVLGNFVRHSDNSIKAPIKSIKTSPTLPQLFSIEKGLDLETNKLFSMTINDKLEIASGTGGTFQKQFANMTNYQRSAMFSLGKRMLSFLEQPNVTESVIVDAKSTWFQLDMAEEMMRRGLDKQVVFQGVTREEAMFASLRQKSIEWNRLMDVQLGGANVTQLREILNLPRAAAWERATDIDDTAIEIFFLGERNANNRALANYDFVSAGHQIAQLKKLPDALDFDNRLDFLGSSFRLGTDVDGKPLQPFFMWRRNLAAADFTRETFGLVKAARYTDVVNQLANTKKSVMASQIAKLVTGLPDFMTAQNMTFLTEASRSSSLPFMGNSISRGIATYLKNSFRDNPTLTSAYQIQQTVQKLIRGHTDQLYNTPVPGRDVTATQAMAKLRSHGSRSSLQFFGQYVSARRHGWHLAPVPEPHTDINLNKVFHKFMLDNSDPSKLEFNRTKWRDLFDEEMPDGAFMPLLKRKDGSIQTLMIDEDALIGAEAMNTLARVLLPEQNAILRGKNMGELSTRNWHLPARDYTGKFTEFIIHTTDGGGKVLKSLVANTQAELNAMKVQPAVKRLLDTPGVVVHSLEDVKQHHRAWDVLWYDMHDAAIAQVQQGKSVKGSSASPLIEEGGQALEDIVSSYNRQVNRLGRDTLKLLFEPQLEYARVSNVAVKSEQAASRGGRDVAERSIFGVYEDVLLGDRALSPDTAIGRAYIWAEDLADRQFKVMYDKFKGDTATAATVKSVQKLLTGKDGQASWSDRRLFNTLKKDMGDHLPFQEAAEFAASRFNIRPPMRLQQVTTELNKITSALVLRYAEIAHPILNLSGVVNTMPAVMSFFRQRSGESPAEYVNRVGLWGHVVPTQQGPMGFLDPVKIMAKASVAHRTKQGRRDWEIMKKRGYGDQAVAEIHKTLGDPGRTEDTVHKLARGADRILGLLSDRSEEISRGWAHMAGVDIARSWIKLTDDDAVHVFAHNFANQVVGDYLSLNRPQIYQGAVGLPLGLFQTYMWNYFSRVFRYVEQKDFRSLTIQAAMQSSIYGGATLPGWAAFTKLFAEAQGDDQIDPVSSLQNAYGSDMADWLLHGTLSNIPKVFGADDGIAMFVRGDANPRIPVPDFPAVNVVGNALSAVGRGIDMFRSGHPGVSTQEVWEILATHSVNRPLRGWIELGLGEAVDRRGNAVSSDTRDGMSFVSRLIGLRPNQEQAQIEAYFTNRHAQSMQHAKRARLRHGLKAAFRGGNFDADLAGNALLEYAKSGGNPAYFRTYLRDTFLNAKVDRQRIQFFEAIKKPGRFREAMRLLNAGVIDDLEE